MARLAQKSPIKKTKRKVPQGGCSHIQATFNNTIITITTLKGEVLFWCSSGVCGFKGARKGTPFAAKTAATTAAKQSICTRNAASKSNGQRGQAQEEKPQYADCKKRDYE